MAANGEADPMVSLTEVASVLRALDHRIDEANAEDPEYQLLKNLITFSYLMLTRFFLNPTTENWTTLRTAAKFFDQKWVEAENAAKKGAK
jgi:hypothetical protein